MSTTAIYEAIVRALPAAQRAMWDAAELHADLEASGRLVLGGQDRHSLQAIVETCGPNLARELLAAGLGISDVVVLDDDGSAAPLDAHDGGLSVDARLADRDVTAAEARAALEEQRVFRMPTARCHHPVFDVNDARSYSPSQPLTFDGYPGRGTSDYTRTRQTVRVELAIAQLLAVCKVEDGQVLTSMNLAGWAVWGRKMSHDEPARLVDELYSILTGAMRYEDVREPPQRPGEARPAYDARVRAFRCAHEIGGGVLEELELVCRDGEVVSLRDLYDPEAPTRLRRPLSNRPFTVRFIPSPDLLAAHTAPVTQLGALFTLVDPKAVHVQSRCTPAYLRALAAPERPDGGAEARQFGLESAAELAEWGEQRAAAANSERRVDRGLRREACERIVEDLREVCRTAPGRFAIVAEPEPLRGSWTRVRIRLAKKASRVSPTSERPRSRYLQRLRGSRRLPAARDRRRWIRQARLRGDTPQRACLQPVDEPLVATPGRLPRARDDTYAAAPT